MQRDKPQMPKTCLDEWGLARFVVEPTDEACHFKFKVFRRRCFKMNSLTTYRPRHNLHGSLGIIAPRSNIDAGKPRITGGKQRCMPSKQPFLGYRSMALAG